MELFERSLDPLMAALIPLPCNRAAFESWDALSIHLAPSAYFGAALISDPIYCINP